MAHNTRPLKRAQDGVAPQYYNRTVDEYEVLEGTAGANHVVIYGPDGQPASLATETKLEAVRALLALLKAELETIKANQLSGDQKVQLSSTIFGADISDRPPANSVPVGTVFVVTNAELDAWISNGTDWVVI